MINKLLDEPYWDELPMVVKSTLNGRCLKDIGIRHLPKQEIDNTIFLIFFLAVDEDENYYDNASNHEEITNYLSQDLLITKDALINEIISRIHVSEKDRLEMSKRLLKEQNLNDLFNLLRDIFNPLKDSLESVNNLLSTRFKIKRL